MQSKQEVIEALEDYEPYAHDLPVVTIKSGVFLAALEALKEQEYVVPYVDIDEAKCPVCKVKLTRQELIGEDVLFEDFYDFCPHCGKVVKWQ